MVSGVNRCNIHVNNNRCHNRCKCELRYGDLPVCFSPDGEKELFFLSDCDRDISTHLQTYGLSKCTKDITDEVDLLLCRAGKLSSLILFSSPFCKVTEKNVQ